LIFCKRNNIKIILLTIFYVFSLLLLFFLYQTVILQKKERNMNIYRHILYVIVYVYILLHIFTYIYIYSYMKNFFTCIGYVFNQNPLYHVNYKDNIYIFLMIIMF